MSEKSIRENCPHFQCGIRQSLMFSWGHKSLQVSHQRDSVKIILSHQRDTIKAILSRW